MKMATFVNIENWTSDQVAEWLRGMDDVILPYGHFFLNNDISGKKLLMMTHSDLDMLGIHKLGHQDVILEAIDLLRSLDENNKNLSNTNTSFDQNGRLSIQTLSAIADIISTITHLVSWLDRAPFHTMYELTLQRNTIVKIGVDLITASQKDHLRQNTVGALMQSCTLLKDICDELVCNSQDPLLVQPAWLELATIPKKPAEELGLHIQSSYNGVHVIGGIKDMSPADTCGKVEKGDEVIAVNYQIVVGWTLQKLVQSLKEKPKEVILVIKKRPCHINSHGVNTGNNRKKAPKNQIATLPKSLQKRRSRESDKPRPSLQELGVLLTDDYTVRDGTDTDNEVFKSGSESPTLRLKVETNKPRRATVSGGSPTIDHPLISPSEETISVGGSSGDRTADENLEGDDTTSEMSLPPSVDYTGQRYLTVEPPLPGMRPHHRPNPKLRGDPLGYAPKNQPMLMKVRRLSSDSESSVKTEDASSYSFSVVGGVLQRAAVENNGVPSDKESPTIRRHLRAEKRKLDRRVSCKDLGEGDCEGWLYRKKKRGGSRILSNKWHKRWCVLKHDNLYCYKQQDDQHAEGVIHLPSFKISPDELETKGITGSKKMFAFRVYNGGTGFYFASDRQEDMSKWMNKMGLAAINYSKLDPNQLSVGYNQGHDIDISDSGDNSDRDVSPVRHSSPNHRTTSEVSSPGHNRTHDSPTRDQRPRAETTPERRTSQLSTPDKSEIISPQTMKTLSSSPDLGQRDMTHSLSPVDQTDLDLQSSIHPPQISSPDRPMAQLSPDQRHNSGLSTPEQHDEELSSPGVVSPFETSLTQRASPDLENPRESADGYDVMLRSIVNAELTVDGVDRKKRRSAAAQSVNLLLESAGEDVKKMKVIRALQRTMKDKEDTLSEIDSLLSGEITSETVTAFYRQNPHLFQPIVRTKLYSESEV